MLQKSNINHTTINKHRDITISSIETNMLLFQLLRNAHHTTISNSTKLMIERLLQDEPRRILNLHLLNKLTINRIFWTVKNIDGHIAIQAY